MKFKAKLLNGLLGGALAALPAVGLSSCDMVKEDLPECLTAELRFVYEYNMEYSNGFPKQVDCLEVLFYDSEGNLVEARTVTDSSLLSDENYRMNIDLPAGDYHVVAYGGMDCEKSSFFHINTPKIGDRYTDLHVQLDPTCLTDPDRKFLHNHFYGTVDFTVDPSQHKVTTVEMMRNTNTIQIALQHVNGSPITADDFIFEITDDNNDFDHANNLLATGEIKYTPYQTLDTGTGTHEPGTEYDEWHAALARFTTSRLVRPKGTSTMLHITRAADGEKILDLPIVNYMLMFKNESPAMNRTSMGDQEYLDRENTWNFVFFLDQKNTWVNTRIIINDWEVRINGSEF